MFDTIAGLPVHALVLHAVVVLVPLCAVGVIVAAVSGRWQERLAVPIVLVLGVAAISSFVAKMSGEELKSRLPANPDIDRHAQLGAITPWAVLTFWLVVLVWFWLERTRGRAAGVTKALMVVAVVAGLGATAMVVVTGDAGSRAVWEDIVEATNPDGSSS